MKKIQLMIKWIAKIRMYKNKKLSRVAGAETEKKKTWSTKYGKIKKRRSSFGMTIIAAATRIKMEVILCQQATAALRPGKLQQGERETGGGGGEKEHQPSLFGPHPWKTFFPTLWKSLWSKAKRRWSARMAQWYLLAPVSAQRDGKKRARSSTLMLMHFHQVDSLPSPPLKTVIG